MSGAQLAEQAGDVRLGADEAYKRQRAQDFNALQRLKSAGIVHDVDNVITIIPGQEVSAADAQAIDRIRQHRSEASTAHAAEIEQQRVDVQVLNRLAHEHVIIDVDGIISIIPGQVVSAADAQAIDRIRRRRSLAAEQSAWLAEEQRAAPQHSDDMMQEEPEPSDGMMQGAGIITQAALAVAAAAAVIVTQTAEEDRLQRIRDADEAWAQLDPVTRRSAGAHGLYGNRAEQEQRQRQTQPLALLLDMANMKPSVGLDHLQRIERRRAGCDAAGRIEQLRKETDWRTITVSEAKVAECADRSHIHMASGAHYGAALAKELRSGLLRLRHPNAQEDEDNPPLAYVIGEYALQIVGGKPQVHDYTSFIKSTLPELIRDGTVDRVTRIILPNAAADWACDDLPPPDEEQPPAFYASVASREYDLPTGSTFLRIKRFSPAQNPLFAATERTRFCDAFLPRGQTNQMQLHYLSRTCPFVQLRFCDTEQESKASFEVLQAAVHPLPIEAPLTPLWKNAPLSEFRQLPAELKNALDPDISRGTNEDLDTTRRRLQRQDRVAQRVYQVSPLQPGEYFEHATRAFNLGWMGVLTMCTFHQINQRLRERCASANPPLMDDQSDTEDSDRDPPDGNLTVELVKVVAVGLRCLFEAVSMQLGDMYHATSRSEGDLQDMVRKALESITDAALLQHYGFEIDKTIEAPAAVAKVKQDYFASNRFLRSDMCGSIEMYLLSHYVAGDIEFIVAQVPAKVSPSSSGDDDDLAILGSKVDQFKRYCAPSKRGLDAKTYNVTEPRRQIALRWTAGSGAGGVAHYDCLVYRNARREFQRHWTVHGESSDHRTEREARLLTAAGAIAPIARLSVEAGEPTQPHLACYFDAAHVVAPGQRFQFCLECCHLDPPLAWVCCESCAENSELQRDGIRDGENLLLDEKLWGNLLKHTEAKPPHAAASLRLGDWVTHLAERAGVLSKQAAEKERTKQLAEAMLVGQQLLAAATAQRQQQAATAARERSTSSAKTMTQEILRQRDLAGKPTFNSRLLMELLGSIYLAAPNNGALNSIFSWTWLCQADQFPDAAAVAANIKPLTTASSAALNLAGSTTAATLTPVLTARPRGVVCALYIRSLLVGELLSQWWLEMKSLAQLAPLIIGSSVHPLSGTECIPQLCKAILVQDHLMRHCANAPWVRSHSALTEAVQKLGPAQNSAGILAGINLDIDAMQLQVAFECFPIIARLYAAANEAARKESCDVALLSNEQLLAGFWPGETDGALALLRTLVLTSASEQLVLWGASKDFHTAPRLCNADSAFFGERMKTLFAQQVINPAHPASNSILWGVWAGRFWMRGRAGETHRFVERTDPTFAVRLPSLRAAFLGDSQSAPLLSATASAAALEERWQAWITDLNGYSSVVRLSDGTWLQRDPLQRDQLRTLPEGKPRDDAVRAERERFVKQESVIKQQQQQAPTRPPKPTEPPKPSLSSIPSEDVCQAHVQQRLDEYELDQEASPPDGNCLLYSLAQTIRSQGIGPPTVRLWPGVDSLWKMGKFTHDMFELRHFISAALKSHAGKKMLQSHGVETGSWVGSWVPKSTPPRRASFDEIVDEFVSATYNVWVLPMFDPQAMVKQEDGTVICFMDLRPGDPTPGASRGDLCDYLLTALATILGVIIQVISASTFEAQEAYAERPESLRVLSNGRFGQAKVQPAYQPPERTITIVQNRQQNPWYPTCPRVIEGSVTKRQRTLSPTRNHPSVSAPGSGSSNSSGARRQSGRNVQPPHRLGFPLATHAERTSESGARTNEKVTSVERAGIGKLTVSWADNTDTEELLANFQHTDALRALSLREVQKQLAREGIDMDD